MNASRKGYRAAMGGRTRWSTCAGAALALVAGPALLSGCGIGHPSSVSSWQSASDRVLGSAISGLGTARLAVQQEADNRMPHSYAVVTATDAIDTTGKEISGYQVAQPPDSLHAANAAVGDALDQASSLLVDVRIALASPGLTADSAHRLVQRIDALRDKLDKLDKAVEKSPAAVGAS